MTAGAPAARVGRGAAWTPLRHRAFRLVWLTFLGVQIANWSETVGAVAVIAGQSGSAVLLALVQTASTIPAVVLALPAGAVADLVDRRLLLIGLVGAMSASMALLATLVAAGAATPSVVLLLTLAMGAAIAAAVPAFASLTPDLVPAADLAPAVALSGISINLARAVGPALAGLALALLSATALFAALAVALAAMALLLVAAPRPARVRAPSAERERLGPAMRAGVRYARSSAALRSVLARGFAFVVPASAMWALLPAVAVHQLGLEPAAFGGILAALGGGAVLGAQLLPWLRARLGLGGLVACGSAYGAVNLVLLGTVHSTVAAVASLVLAGAAWMAVLSSLNTAAQLAAPAWVRGRVLSINQLVFAAGMAGGSALWGVLAEAIGLEAALLAAAGVLGLSLLAALRWSLSERQAR